ncbi:MAG TPA: hypothetical protein VEI97_19875 [bacterium]|nr:hypothetical protein [bacterium]
MLRDQHFGSTGSDFEHRCGAKRLRAGTGESDAGLGGALGEGGHGLVPDKGQGAVVGGWTGRLGDHGDIRREGRAVLVPGGPHRQRQHQSNGGEQLQQGAVRHGATSINPPRCSRRYTT